MFDRMWITNDGRLLKIGEMSEDHIQRCIACILRSGGRWRQQYLQRLQLELIIRSLK
jgi:hypothetical protein